MRSGCPLTCSKIGLSNQRAPLVFLSFYRSATMVKRGTTPTGKGGQDNRLLCFWEGGRGWGVGLNHERTCIDFTTTDDRGDQTKPCATETSKSVHEVVSLDKLCGSREGPSLFPSVCRVACLVCKSGVGMFFCLLKVIFTASGTKVVGG